MRAAGVRIVEDAGLALVDPELNRRRYRVRHRAEMHGDVLGLRHHAAALVEDRGRAVATLLDVRRERRADEHCAHLLGNCAQRASEYLKLDVHHRRRTSVPSSFVDPLQPAGTQQVEPGSSSKEGPSTAWPVAALKEMSGPGITSAVRTATSSIARSRSA